MIRNGRGVFLKYGGERQMLQTARSFEVQQIRSQFPALNRQRNGALPVFLDGPGGTQVPTCVIDAIVDYLSRCNANHGGVFATSRESDAIVAEAHQAMADLLNAPSPEEIIFGQNMTSLTMHLSRAISRILRPGDEILVTRLDHDANVTPWVLAARDAGAFVRYVDIHTEDCTLDLEDLQRQLSSKTRLVAVGCASNAVGTINDVAAICRLAHSAGAWCFLDAVHYAPHGPIDVQAWGCDLLACSAYKFFGPHVGILWGKRQILEELPVYKLRPVPDRIPDAWMTGTQNHEALAGAAAAVGYLAEIGRESAKTNGSSRSRVRAAMEHIQLYEQGLAAKLLHGLAERPRWKVWGITDANRLSSRVPTVSITCKDFSPEAIARDLADCAIYAWNGNMYAIGLTERLGIESQGGILRLGLVHYNTVEEIDRLLAALDEMGG
jgi:cysteine desulfurase family protein (TIGR01976 family)